MNERAPEVATALAEARATVTALLRDVPDFPKPGVVFRDIAGLLADGDGLRAAVEALAVLAGDLGPIDLVAGMEARGFMFAAPLATRLGVGFVPVRKAGKLPPPVLSATYELEYGQATLEVRDGTVPAGARVLVIDDILATGGTAAAGVDLLERAGAHVAGLVFLFEIAEIGGRARLEGHEVRTLLS